MEAGRLPERLAAEIANRYCNDTEQSLPSERQLARILGASRAMVREALTILRARGTIEGKRGHSPVALLAPPDPHSLEMIEARTVLEGEIAAIAALRAGPQGFQSLRERVSRMLEAESPEDYWQAELELHLALIRLSQNRVLRMLAEPIVREAYTLPPPDHLIERMRLHQRLTAAVGRAQPQLARDIIAELLSTQVLSPTSSG